MNRNPRPRATDEFRNRAIRAAYAQLVKVVSVNAALRALEVDQKLSIERIRQIVRSEPARASA